MKSPRAAILVLPALLLLLGGAAWLQDDADVGVSSWLPARTLFCVETADPSRLADELARLFAPDPARPKPAGWVAEALFWLSPEGLPELRKIDSAAFAILGVGPSGAPQQALLLKTGGAAALPLGLQKAIAAGEWKEHQTIAGVKTYYSARDGRLATKVDAQGELRNRLVGTDLLAVFPAGVAYGSPEAVSEILLRAHGQGVGPALAANAAWRLKKKQAGVGLFVHADLGKLLEAGLAPRGLERAAPPNAWRQLAGQILLRAGAVAGRATLELSPGKPAGLLDLAPAAGASPAVLSFVPASAEALVLWRVRPEEGEKLVGALDQFARSSGADARLASELLHRLDEPARLNLAREFAGRLDHAAAAQLAAGFGFGLPLFVLEAKNDEAKSWLLQNGLPRLAQALSDAAQPPAWEASVAEGLKCLDLGGGRRLQVGSVGRTLVLALDHNATAQALADGAGGKGLREAGTLAGLFEAGDEPGLIFAVRPLRLRLRTEAPFGRKDPPAPPLAGGAGAGAAEFKPAAPAAPSGVMTLPPPPPGAAPPPAPPLLLGGAAEFFADEDWLAVGLRRTGAHQLTVMLGPTKPRPELLLPFLANLRPQTLADLNGLPGGGKLDVQRMTGPGLPSQMPSAEALPFGKGAPPPAKPAEKPPG